jgi:hypothetical protein
MNLGKLLADPATVGLRLEMCPDWIALTPPLSVGKSMTIRGVWAPCRTHVLPEEARRDQVSARSKVFSSTITTLAKNSWKHFNQFYFVGMIIYSHRKEWKQYEKLDESNIRHQNLVRV